jgi:hypothetical protein
MSEQKYQNNSQLPAGSSAFYLVGLFHLYTIAASAQSEGIFVANDADPEEQGRNDHAACTGRYVPQLGA